MSGAIWDVVVIGAGAAGLAAARAALEFGLATVVLEAKERIGGRAWTDSDSVGVPWERGANWLHSAERTSSRAVGSWRVHDLVGRRGYVTCRGAGSLKCFASYVL